MSKPVVVVVEILCIPASGHIGVVEQLCNVYFKRICVRREFLSAHYPKRFLQRISSGS